MYVNIKNENRMKKWVYAISVVAIIVSCTGKNNKAEEQYKKAELLFEQGEHNSFYYSEEIFSSVVRNKNIRVSDRATLFNLLIGLNGYTISTGILSEDLNGKDIVSVPLNVEERMTVGYIVHKNIGLSKIALSYIEKLQHYIFQQLNEKMKKLW